MRLVVPVLLLAFVLGLCPAPSVAEDGPDGEAAEPQPKDGGWDGDTFWFARLLAPSEVQPVVTKKLADVPRAKQRSERARLIREYLEVRDATGPDVAALEPDELQSLYRLYAGIYEYGKAHQTLETLLATEGLEEETKDAAMSGLASLLSNSRSHEPLGEEVVAALAAKLEAYLGERTGDDAGTLRGAIHGALARYASAMDDDEASIRHNMLSAVEDPSRAAGVARGLVRSLQSSTHDMEGYEMLRSNMAAVLPVLRHLAARHLASVAEAGDERAIGYAERGVKMLETADHPFEMLGRPAEDWTLERAYGDVTSLEDLRGKVVVLDFWATWCPWCIKSFPAIRDLLKDYARDDLAVVGVTASATTVYDQRWDLDDDLKDKAGEQRPKAVARLVRGTAEPDPENGVFAEPEFREAEKKALETFIRNHEMTWPVVMIDKTEPGPKYAVGGWPHAVVLDRQGRVRYFKVGALLRDRPEAVAAFRAVLDDLIAEEAAVTRPADDAEAAEDATK